MSTKTNEQNDFYRDIVRQLRLHNIAPTTQRIQIASVMLSRPQHLSAEQVMELANADWKHVSKSTVYNTLGLFAEKGLIRELVVDPARSFYDSSTHHHHHYFNPETQELTNIDDGEMEVNLPTNLPADTEIDHVEVVVHLRSRR